MRDFICHACKLQTRTVPSVQTEFCPKCGTRMELVPETEAIRGTHSVSRFAESDVIEAFTRAGPAGAQVAANIADVTNNPLEATVVAACAYLAWCQNFDVNSEQFLDLVRRVIWRPTPTTGGPPAV